MLVLSRKIGESIVLDGCIVVTIVEVRGDKVRLGIEAPRSVPVYRHEIQQIIESATERTGATEGLVKQGAD